MAAIFISAIGLLQCMVVAQCPKPKSYTISVADHTKRGVIPVEVAVSVETVSP